MSRSFTAVAYRLAGLVPRTLGWLPQNFWEATPAEIAAIFATGDAPQGEPLTRTELQTLMERDRDG